MFVRINTLTNELYEVSFRPLSTTALNNGVFEVPDRPIAPNFSRDFRYDGSIGNLRAATPAEIADWLSSKPAAQQRTERDRLNTLPDTSPVQIGDLKRLGLLG